ncbi:potassium transporter Kup [Zoogloea sp. G-4-1-14]|jgi:KUP system potassium uptake protein|uniref:Probable potassium transport system protein Kup n=2 Tax=Zoogloea dura TaxID=2728840 RepID=A0A848FZT9_9RHOO|nr:potassium transporter Kup [Zoogloea dura]
MSANSVAGHDKCSRTQVMPVALAAMGVVFGDIGTSPLYTMKEVFNAHHGLAVTPDNVLGVLSLVFWALTIVVSLKYVVFIMRADNRGEGGIMALTSLALRTTRSPRLASAMAAVGLFGAALFYGDGVITPAISVLSAVEGLEVATPAFRPYVLPISLVVLTGLFLIQSKGTARVGAVFGPVMLFWFATLGVLGAINVLRHPDVLRAINPAYALAFFEANRGLGFLALGAVVLAITGGEALYADMGHFGRRPIKMAWFGFVFPALYLNYLGQGALILDNPEAVKNPFYLLVPEPLLYPMVALSTLATIIASQAVISGAFSLTKQAVQLGYSPRIHVVHTSEKEVGQIYVPNVNWMLLASVVALVLGFRSSSALASAYGIAVTLTMMIDTVLAFFVVRTLWNWGLGASLAFLLLFFSVDFAFFSANTVKIFDGGWFPLALGLAIHTLLMTWKQGRAALAERMRIDTMPLDLFIQSMFHDPPIRVPGTGVFMTTAPDGVPRALLHNLLHNKVLHARVVLVNVITDDVPYVPASERVRVEELDFGFFRVFVRYGFKDDPDIPSALGLCESQGLPFELMESSFFLGRENLIPKASSFLGLWRKRLFILMFRNAHSAADFFCIPANRVVEFGTQVEL